MRMLRGAIVGLEQNLPRKNTEGITTVMYSFHSQVEACLFVAVSTNVGYVRKIGDTTGLLHPAP